MNHRDNSKVILPQNSSLKQYLKMKKHTISTVSVLLLALIGVAGSLSASAQGLRTGYLSDSYVYRHQVNPALGNTSGYVSMPVLGNFALGVNSNIGVKNFIYKGSDGRLTTFMNSDVSAGEFLGDLNDDNLLSLNVDLSVISVGFNMLGGYSTIDLGAHARGGLSLPKSLFAFMKEMKSDQTYDLSDMQGNGRVYADLALGHSRQITDELRVGAKVKFLFGILYANAKFDDTKATFGHDAWDMQMRGKVEVAGGGYFTTDDDGNVDGYEDLSANFNGFGMAFDLGATYDLGQWVEGLTVSAALTDLGWIKWKDVAVAYADGEPFTFDGFHELTMHDLDDSEKPFPDASGRRVRVGSFDDQWDVIEEDLEDMYSLVPDRELGTKAEALGATLTIGAEYTLPVYKKISFGAFFTQRFGEIYKYTEGRAIVNYAPSRLFDLALSGSVSSYGAGFGVLANLHCPGFNLFMGTDQFYCGSINSDFVPLDNAFTQVQFGINFPFGF